MIKLGDKREFEWDGAGLARSAIFDAAEDMRPLDKTGPYGIKILQDQLALKEKYWREWNEQAANPAALIDGENERLRHHVAELKKDREIYKVTKECNELRQRVAELEEQKEALLRTCEAYRATHKERGERMKALAKSVGGMAWWMKNFDAWFDPETGEPL